MRKHKRLSDAYRFPGFSTNQEVIGIFGDPKARVIRLKRLQKKLDARTAEKAIMVFTTASCGVYGIFHVATPGSIWRWKFAACIVRDAGK